MTVDKTSGGGITPTTPHVSEKPQRKSSFSGREVETGAKSGKVPDVAKQVTAKPAPPLVKTQQVISPGKASIESLPQTAVGTSATAKAVIPAKPIPQATGKAADPEATKSSKGIPIVCFKEGKAKEVQNLKIYEDADPMKQQTMRFAQVLYFLAKEKDFKGIEDVEKLTPEELHGYLTYIFNTHEKKDIDKAMLTWLSKDDELIKCINEFQKNGKVTGTKEYFRQSKLGIKLSPQEKGKLALGMKFGKQKITKYLHEVLGLLFSKAKFPTKA
jgi:hypothetical protein